MAEVLSVLARRKGGTILWSLGEVSGLLPVRLSGRKVSSTHDNMLLMYVRRRKMNTRFSPVFSVIIQLLVDQRLSGGTNLL